MEKQRYAVIPIVRLQIDSYTNNAMAVNPMFNHIVDLKDHPQADEIDIGWFYDPTTGTFSAEGEVQYPDPEPMPAQPLTFDQAVALEMANNIDYLVCLKDLGL